MIDPSPKALRRRAFELQASASREATIDADASALLLFYAAECGLKASYMMSKQLVSTNDQRGGAQSARSFVHDLVRLINALNIPRAAISAPPTRIVRRTTTSISVDMLHQAWRYGEKVDDTQAICAWLTSILKWCKSNL